MIRLTDLCHQHSVCFHGCKCLVRETARGIRISTDLALHTASCTDWSHLRIFLSQFFFQFQKMLFVECLCLHHGLSVQFILQFSHCLYNNSMLILVDDLLTFLQTSASRRAAPAFSISVTGILLTHCPHFRHQFNRFTVKG